MNLTSIGFLTDLATTKDVLRELLALPEMTKTGQQTIETICHQKIDVLSAMK